MYTVSLDVLTTALVVPGVSICLLFIIQINIYNKIHKIVTMLNLITTLYSTETADDSADDHDDEADDHDDAADAVDEDADAYDEESDESDYVTIPSYELKALMDATIREQGFAAQTKALVDRLVEVENEVDSLKAIIADRAIAHNAEITELRNALVAEKLKTHSTTVVTRAIDWAPSNEGEEVKVGI